MRKLFAILPLVAVGLVFVAACDQQPTEPDAAIDQLMAADAAAKNDNPCSGKPDFQGDDGDDTWYGGDDSEKAVGGGGEDRLWSYGGDDCLNGGDGDDVLGGGDGADRLHGDDGDDTLYGHNGNDVLEGGPGKDTFLGGPGDDVIWANDGQRDGNINCGPGYDVVHLDHGVDTQANANCEKLYMYIYGTEEDDGFLQGTRDYDDYVYGLAGNDRIMGYEGDDQLFGGPGKDTFLGGPGDDVIWANDGELDGNINCGPGYDIVHLDDGLDNLVNSNCEEIVKY